MSISIKFNRHYNVAILQKELQTCVQYSWTEHFNQKDYEGRWDCIALRSIDGKNQTIAGFGNTDPYLDTPLLDSLPYMRYLIDSIPGIKESVRLMALYPDSEIKAHRDLDCSYRDGIYRIHVPICTNPDVEFYLEEERITMEEGTCWYLDFSKTHQIVNRSAQVRVHLVIDGIRDTDTDAWFVENGYTEPPIADYDVATKKAMITNLEMMDSDTARQLIMQLKKELQDA